MTFLVAALFGVSEKSEEFKFGHLKITSLTKKEAQFFHFEGLVLSPDQHNFFCSVTSLTIGKITKILSYFMLPLSGTNTVKNCEPSCHLLLPSQV